MSEMAISRQLTKVGQLSTYPDFRIDKAAITLPK